MKLDARVTYEGYRLYCFFSLNFEWLAKGINTPSGTFEVLMLGLILGNGSGTDFGVSQCIPMGPCR